MYLHVSFPRKTISFAITFADFIYTQKAVEGFLARAKEIDPSPLSEESRLDLTLLKEELKTYLEGFPAKGFVSGLNTYSCFGQSLIPRHRLFDN